LPGYSPKRGVSSSQVRIQWFWIGTHGEFDELVG